MTRPDDHRQRDLCAQRFDDDSDFRYDRKRQRRDTDTPHRKDHQLSRQVESALVKILACVDIDQPDAAIELLSVEPDPFASRVVVVLAPAALASEAAARARLPRLVAELRSELARRLARKRLPGLHLLLLPAQPLSSDEGRPEHA